LSKALAARGLGLGPTAFRSTRLVSWVCPSPSQPRLPEPLDEGWLARLRLAQRLDAKPEVATLAAGCEVPQVDEEPHGLVVVLGLLGGDEAVDLGPQLGLAADEAVEVLLPGDRCLALAPGLLLGALLGLDALALRREGLGC